jgi:hypothetical protein
MCRKQSAAPSFALMSTTSHGSGKLFASHLDAETAADEAAAAVAGDEPARAHPRRVLRRRRAHERLSILYAFARHMRDGDLALRLVEADDVATAQLGDIRIARQELFHPDFEKRLVKKIAHGPAIGAVEAPELAEHGTVLQHPLHGAVDDHVGVELVRDARSLEYPHAFVVGIDSPGIAVELRLAFERQHLQSPAAEQMRERQSRGPEPDDHDVPYVLRCFGGPGPYH